MHASEYRQGFFGFYAKDLNLGSRVHFLKSVMRGLARRGTSFTVSSHV